jgi:hypothetical protein
MLSRTVRGFVASLLALVLMFSTAYPAGDMSSRARATIMATAYVEPCLGLTGAAVDLPADFTLDPDKNLYWLYHPNLDGVKVLIEGDARSIETVHLQTFGLVSLISLSPAEPGQSVTVTVIYTDN